MDKPSNGGFICEKHGVGYIGLCPTCASIKNTPKITKKQSKVIRQLLRKSKR